MDTLNFKEVIPLSVWAFSSAVGMMVILIAMFLYFYYRKRLQALVGDGSNAADLASKVAQLKKDEDVLRDWMARQKDELQSLASERQDQFLVQAELQRIEQECAKNEEFNRSLRNEVGSLENKKYLLAEKSQKLEQEIGESEKNIEQLQNQKE
jgi:tRNA A37 N6-isopentenylltransferase MiaA